MESKIIVRMMLLVATLVFVIVLVPMCSAQSNLTIKDVSVELIKTRPPVGEIIIREFRIAVILCNTGDTISTPISVKFQDPEAGISGNLTMQPLSYALQPNEEKTFVFENWPTILSGAVILNISFAPVSPYVFHDSSNSGFYLYTLNIGNGQTTTSTPGFEILIALAAVVALLLKKHIKR